MIKTLAFTLSMLLTFLFILQILITIADIKLIADTGKLNDKEAKKMGTKIMTWSLLVIASWSYLFYLYQ